MLKKLALAVTVVCALPFLSPDFRRGYKIGWNDQYDVHVANGHEFKYFRKFKNV